MPSASQIVICAAGGGKTTRIVRQACQNSDTRSLLVTYTINNEREIQRKFHEHGPTIPSNIEVMTWFRFVLRELSRPYRSAMHGKRIEGIYFVKDRSARYTPEHDTSRHYFFEDRYIYSDKITKFVCKCNKITSGAVMHRLAMRFDHIFVDEAQDLSGYDLDLIELILKAGINLTLIGDHRQSTLKTNQSNRNQKFGGENIIEKFKEWDKDGLAHLSYERHTHRCHQDIANLGDSLFPREPQTTSLNDVRTGHDGVFVVATSQVAAYVASYNPQILRFNRTTSCGGLVAMNFGESKGLTFNHVLIFPHGAARKWLSTGKLSYIEKSVTRMYVGVTRARHSLAFVYDGVVAIPGAQTYSSRSRS